MSDVRLIERWLPIAEIGEESMRERRSLSALPAVYYLHVWWARRPLVASRAAILASALPEDADREKFLQTLGIHGDPIKTKALIDRSKRTGENLGPNPYGYERAFKYRPNKEQKQWISGKGAPRTVLDPTAGGGSIPFEAARLGLNVYSNDLNPVASLVEMATVKYPIQFGSQLKEEFSRLSRKFLEKSAVKFREVYPPESQSRKILGYIWARNVRCPYCEGMVPLSPNWRLAGDGTGLLLKTYLGSGPGDTARRCSFEVVDKASLQSEGTVSGGDATCPYSDCGRFIDGNSIKEQAQGGTMGDQLIAIAYKDEIPTITKAGKRGRSKWVRGYRVPSEADNNLEDILRLLEEKSEEWAAFDIIPNERIGDPSNYDRGHRLYGMNYWKDMFAPRQLLCHGMNVETYREIWEEEQSAGLSELTRAAFVYLALSLDKLTAYNARSSMWDNTTGRIRQVFSNHNFSMSWSYAEFAACVTGGGLEWVFEQTSGAIDELVSISGGSSDEDRDLFAVDEDAEPSSKMIFSCKSGDSLDHIDDACVDVIVMDPPYYDNVMYAELSDFFYVWLKRTAGHVLPDLFTRLLTDKENEAVANRAKFSDTRGAGSLAGRDYQERMSRIFAECSRVLKTNGIMTLMFTHKASGAWDALTTGLVNAGFTITASWPVSTEAESSLHIRNKAAANSTIFLVCRPRPAEQSDETTYWEDVEPLVAKAVRTRVEEFQKAGIGGVDLYLASFGPALEEFSRHWPLKRGTPRPEPLAKKRRKQAELFEEEFDPYAVTPEDALDAARREVKTWRLNQLTHTKGRADLDPTTSWFVLAWDAFKAPKFSFDEGLRLARAVGADLEGQLIGKICEKKGSDIVLWDSATRAAKSGLGPADGSRAMIDAIHHAAHRGRTRTLDSALDLLKDAGLENDPQFLASLEAVLEVLPPSRGFVGFDVATGDAKSASDDFDSLEKLRRLAFSDKVDEPQQLSLFAEEAS